MGRNGESGALGLAAARGGVEQGVGARFARFGTGGGTSNVASLPLRDRTDGDAQSRQSKISEFSARTKPAGFENRRRVHTRKYHLSWVSGLILALSIVKSQRGRDPALSRERAEVPRQRKAQAINATSVHNKPY